MVVVDKKRIYANIFCAICNEPSYKIRLDCGIGRVDDSHPIVIVTQTDLLEHGYAIPVRTKVLTNFVDVCPKDQWKHPKRRCQKLQCIAGKLPGPEDTFTCLTPVERVRGLGYHLSMLFRPVSLMLKIVRDSPAAVLKSSGEPPVSSSKGLDFGEEDRKMNCDYYARIKEALQDFLYTDYFDMSGTIIMAHVWDGACFHEVYQSRLENLKYNANISQTFVDNKVEQRELEMGKDLQTVASFLIATAELDIIDIETRKRDTEESILLSIFETGLIIPVGDWTVKLEVLDMTSGLYGDGFTMYVGSDGTARFLNYSEMEHLLHGLEYLFLPVSNCLFCQHVSFHRDEFQVDSSDDEMQISFPFYVDSDLKPVSFDPRAYPRDVWITENELVMCFMTFVDVFPENVSYVFLSHLSVVSQSFGKSKALKITSEVCISISTACLILTFITYSLFSELRSLPGLNNMGLSLTLAAANISLLMSWIRTTGNKSVCTVVGVVTHWLWLMALLWMGVCCVHMLCVFISKTRVPLSQREKKKAFVRNILFTVMVSAGIVVLTIVTSAAMSGGSSIGYGGRNCFFDTGLYPLLPLAFMLPLGVVVITNLICLFLTLCAIWRVRHLQAQTGKDRWAVLVYAKLALVTGGTWLLALVAKLMDRGWLLVLAELSIASQGLLVFLSFVCNKHVWHLYRARVGSCIQPVTPSTSAAVALSSGNKTPPADV